MGVIKGSRTVEIDAPIQRCYDIAADIEGAPVWQGSLKKATVVERDGRGDAVVVETESDAVVKTVKARLRFTYSEPTKIRWTQEKGEVKSLVGGWDLEDLGGDGTRATYWLEADPGRMLGMLMRGPVEGKVRDMLVGDAAAGLKKQAEAP